jgi:hypothetical protein
LALVDIVVGLELSCIPDVNDFHRLVPVLGFVDIPGERNLVNILSLHMGPDDILSDYHHRCIPHELGFFHIYFHHLSPDNECLVDIDDIDVRQESGDIPHGSE